MEEPALPVSYDLAPWSQSGPADADRSERRWVAYAWPVAVGNSGTRVFAVDQDGEVVWAPNDVVGYTGTADVGCPRWDAAFAADGGPAWESPLAHEAPGRDGQTWTRTR